MRPSLIVLSGIQTRVVRDVEPTYVASAIGVAVAAGSLLFAVHADQRSRRSLALAEANDRRDRARHQRERSADLEIVGADYRALPPDRNRRYNARIRNIGAAPARHVRVWIVDGGDSKPIRLFAHRFYNADLTIPPDEMLTVELDVGAALLRNSLRFCLAWTDDAGEWLADGPMCPGPPHPMSGSTLVRSPDAQPKRRGAEPLGV
jgi:hypothetical protein